MAEILSGWADATNRIQFLETLPFSLQFPRNLLAYLLEN